MIIKEHNELGRLLEAQRYEEKLTIDEQAAKYKLSSALISRIGTGDRILSPKMAKKILDHYKDNPEFTKEFVIAWIKQMQEYKKLPMPKNNREALVAAYFLLGDEYVKEKVFV